jgi:TPR repeat protein
MKYKFNSLSMATVILLGLTFNTAFLTPLWAMEYPDETSEGTLGQETPKKQKMDWGKFGSFDKCMEQANEGSPSAQYKMGQYYKKNKLKEMAYDYFEQAASGGLMTAQYRKGLMLLEDQGTEKNEQEGIRFIMRAADRGFEKARFEYVRMVVEDRIVEKNLEKAIAYMEKVEKDSGLKYQESRFYLGLLYQNQNSGYAKSCFEAALDGLDIILRENPNEARALWMKGKVYKYGLQDFELAHNSFLAAAALESAESQYELGLMSQKGEGGPDKDLKQADYYFREAAKRGHKKAKTIIGPEDFVVIGEEEPTTPFMPLLPPLQEKEDFKEKSEEKLDPEIKPEHEINWDDPEVFLSFLTKADLGDLQAQYKLGLRSKKKKEKATALGFFTKAAESGLACAQYRLGIMHLKGRGTERDEQEGARHIILAAEQNFLPAQLKWGSLLLRGKDINKDEKMGASLIEMVALRELPKAQLKFGLMMLNGRGVAKNEPKGAGLIKLAADKACKKARLQYGLMALYGRGIPKKEREAIRYLKMAQGLRYFKSEYYLGLLYQKGIGTNKNENKAKTYFQSALAGLKKRADMLDAKALYRIGMVYKHGLKDPSLAFKSFLTATSLGYAEAQYQLALMLDNGEGDVEVDLIEAFRHFKLAADQGHAKARTATGFMYQIGRGVEQSDITTQIYFTLAAEQGEREGEFLRAQFLLQSWKKDDRRKARELLWSSARKGCERAKEELRRQGESNLDLNFDDFIFLENEPLEEKPAGNSA